MLEYEFETHDEMIELSAVAGEMLSPGPASFGQLPQQRRNEQSNRSSSEDSKPVLQECHGT